MEGIDADLEKLSFDLAKAEWIDRHKDDRDVLRDLDALDGILKRNKGRVRPNDHDLYRRCLQVMPIWITTAQSTQAIPMEPELFDLVVIDEASQCTLTNLLPLLYRGTRIAVIGDSNQLPAIPHIQSGEESLLAKKNCVEEWLGLLGHSSNNVYDTAVKTLPRGRADVIMLTDHFRSHPLIIGFSNQLIYNSRLRLYREPEQMKEVPRGGGVHALSVPGRCVRGDRGRSWKNPQEATAVVDLIAALRKEAGSHLTIGVVTPFRPHYELIRDLLEERSLLKDVTIGTAHTFQGDERDIMVFSLVAARGISSGTVKWMGDPPNLVNVAITRARESLFVLGDLDFCRTQPGIIGELVRYCDGIQSIREQEVTSHEELDLYSQLVLENLNPQVHKIVGDIEVDFILERDGVKLAIEVDGGQHDGQVAEDNSRDAFLRARGYGVLRFRTREVRETPALVMKKIVNGLEG